MENRFIRAKIIVNPDSHPRIVKHYFRPAVNVLRSNGFDVSVSFSKEPGEALPIAEEAARQGFNCVIAAGGDGTINEVINGIYGKDITLGLFPCGSCNVLARELSIPFNLIQAAELIVKRYKRKIDLGCISGRYFSMMASCGYDAYAVSRINQKIKKIIRRYAYVWAGMKDLIWYRPTQITLIIDEGKIQEKGTFVTVGNTHFYGGTYQVTPFAEIDDGFLDICIYQGNTQLGLVRFVFRLFWKQHLKLKKVKYYRAKHVDLYASRRTLVQVDGDFLGELPMTVRIIPKAIEVYC
jgi:diacylglycerol kinase (ATP)